MVYTKSTLLNAKCQPHNLNRTARANIEIHTHNTECTKYTANNLKWQAFSQFLFCKMLVFIEICTNL